MKPGVSPHAVKITGVYNVCKIFVIPCSLVDAYEALCQLIMEHPITRGPHLQPYNAGDLVVAGPLPHLHPTQLYRFLVITATTAITTTTTTTSPLYYDLYCLDSGCTANGLSSLYMREMRVDEAQWPRFATRVSLSEDAQWLPASDSGADTLDVYLDKQSVYDMRG